LTDKNINVNEKFQRPYTIENWAHVLACSNSKKALRIEESDRRWFYPQLNEVPWTREQWGEFYQWLNGGGLSVIMRWAQEYGNYVLPGEHAPMTLSKQALIRDSKGEVLNHWMDIMESVELGEERLAFALNDVRDSLRKRHGKIYESALDFRREAVRRGWFSMPARMEFGGGMTYVVLSPALADGKGVRDIDPRDQELRELIRGSLKSVEERLSAVQ
jgi:hypothetical protein